MTPSGDLVTDERGVITEASDAVSALFAIEPRWLIGKPLASFIRVGDRRRFRTLLLDIATRNEHAVESLCIENRDRTPIHVELSAARRGERVVWTVDPERPHAAPGGDATVEAPDRWAQRLLARLPTGVVVVDSRLNVVFVNPAARRLFGGEPIGRGEPLPDWAGEFSLREHAGTLFGDRPALGRRTITIATDGEPRTVTVDGLTSVDRDTAVLMFEDVTSLERTRRAERQFIENAAHELRTPLAAIATAIDVLESGAQDDPATRGRFLGHIRAQSDRLSRLTGSLLTLARIQTGQAYPALDLVSARALLEEVAADLDPAHGVDVFVIAPPDVGALADRELLRQALANVAANAARYTRTGSITFEARDLGATTEIEIRDTGPGMSADERDHAFDRFYRAQTSGSNGFGLGLAIAEEAVTAIGGSITLISKAGEGTRVRVGLPSAKIAR